MVASRERQREEEQAVALPLMKDKIVEARPRSSKRSSSQKENKKSNGESSVKQSNGSKTDLDPRAGTNDKFFYKTDLRSARLVNGASPKLSNGDRGDLKNKSKKDLEDIKAIIKLDRLNSTESKLSNNSFDFP